MPRSKKRAGKATGAAALSLADPTSVTSSTGAARVVHFRDEPDSFEEEVENVKSGSFDPTPLFVPPTTNALAEEPMNEIKARLEDGVMSMVDKYRTRILGVEFASLVADLLASLAVSRKTGAYDSLIMDLTFGVSIGYTISRVAVEDYELLGDNSVLLAYEISDRKRADTAEIAKKNSWVEKSGMNAAAARLIGYLVVECAPERGFLHDVKVSKGTPFSPVSGEKELEKLISEASKTVSDRDRDALAAFRDEFQKMIAVLNALWGAGGVSVETARKAAASVKGAIM